MNFKRCVITIFLFVLTIKNSNSNICNKEWHINVMYLFKL